MKTGNSGKTLENKFSAFCLPSRNSYLPKRPYFLKVFGFSSNGLRLREVTTGLKLKEFFIIPQFCY